MAQIIVRNLDASIKSALQERAALRGTSMEAEVREILRHAVVPRRSKSAGWATRVNARFARLDMPEFTPVRSPPLEPAELPD